MCLKHDFAAARPSMSVPKLQWFVQTKTLSENGAGSTLYDPTLQQHREREV